MFGFSPPNNVYDLTYSPEKYLPSSYLKAFRFMVVIKNDISLHMKQKSSHESKPCGLDLGKS